MRGLHHVNDNPSCFFQVKDFHVLPLLITIELLDGDHVLRKLLDSSIQLLLGKLVAILCNLEELDLFPLKRDIKRYQPIVQILLKYT